MMRRHASIILSYGLFLGWLLSFAYNGPVLKELTSQLGLRMAPYSLTYTAAPVLFLVVYAFLSPKDEYSKKMMVWSGGACALGTLYLFLTPPVYWYPALAATGICSVVFIIGWSYFYTMEVPVGEKLPVMALVIFTGNAVYYAVNVLHTRMPKFALLMMLQAALIASIWVSSRVSVTNQIFIPLKEKPFPTRLVSVTCFLLFLININDGLTFHAIYPSFERLFPSYSTYYATIPYLITLLLLYYLGRRMSLILPVFLGTSLLGLAYLSFGLLTENRYSYFVTDTLLQSGWALMDLVLWTLFGLVASVYGRPLKICGLAFLANLFGVFTGGVLSVQVIDRLHYGYPASAAFAVSIIFGSLLMVYWLDQSIERDLRKALWDRAQDRSPAATGETSCDDSPTSDVSSASIRIPHREILSRREKEIADLLIRGFTNKRIAEMLNISKNTMKTHTKNIYAKLDVANKRELLQSSYLIELPNADGTDPL